MGGVEIGVKVRAAGHLDAVVGPKRLRAIAHFNLLEWLLPLMRRGKGRVQRSVPVLREHNVVEFNREVMNRLDHRIAVHEGDFATMLSSLDPGYDVAFFDGNAPVPALHSALRNLLRTGGLLITANLNHGGTADAVWKALFDGKSWRSALIDAQGETAVSVKL